MSLNFWANSIKEKILADLSLLTVDTQIELFSQCLRELTDLDGEVKVGDMFVQDSKSYQDSQKQVSLLKDKLLS